MKICTQQSLERINAEIAEFFVPRLGKLITDGIGPGQEVRLVISRKQSAWNDHGDICSIYVETEEDRKEEVMIVVRKHKDL